MEKAEPTSGKLKVVTYSLLDRLDEESKYTHWSDGLKMIITKGNVTLKLNSEDIEEIVKALPRTIGGKY